MARPKTGKPPKKSLNLTISEETREDLNFLSVHHGESISALVSTWATEKADAIAPRSERSKRANNSTKE